MGLINWPIKTGLFPGKMEEAHSMQSTEFSYKTGTE